ncbi:hypothetical protein DR864_12245 [Runella rosea]|uniref:WGR domain-containing protein n=2 Tax=Runella rosea TaxID=2259595 RepID=A0A344TIJ8_9BACT|nr:hypothetical protein DR864_12245 [Runella rosea]
MFLRFWNSFLKNDNKISMTKNLIFQDDFSNKFWRVSVENSTLTVIYGRIGTAGRSDSKEFPSNLEAEKEANKLIAEKLKKGYEEDNNINFSEADFWNIIERAKKSSEGDYEYQADLLTELLQSRPISEIIEFDNIFSELHRKSYRSDWWGAAYLINGGCSDDGFDYFRAWVISRGQKAYYEAWKNPESLLKYINEDNIGECYAETLMYSASIAYEQKTDKDDFHDKTYSLPLPEIVFDWQEDDDSLQIKFPKLFKKCKDLGF